MRAFLRRHRRELPRDRTVFLNLDEVGAGTPCFAVREGPVLAARAHEQLTGLCEEADARPVAVASRAATASPRATPATPRSPSPAATSTAARRCITAAATCPSTWSAMRSPRPRSCASSWPRASTRRWAPSCARPSRARPTRARRRSRAPPGLASESRLAARSGSPPIRIFFTGTSSFLPGQRARHLGHGHDPVRHVPRGAVLAHAAPDPSLERPRRARRRPP